MGVEPINLPNTIAVALRSAGERSGVDFGYLVDTAVRESSLNPSAKARTSTATGLFQFLESTWLGVMKEEGPRLGYSQYADQITKNGSGKYVVEDPASRDAILKLREDPQVAADLAAAYTKDNGDFLTERFGRQPSAGELYIAHFLGASGADRLFSAGLKNPDQAAAPLFPEQAAANPSIFFQDGQPRTVRDLYKSLVGRHETGATDASFTAQQLASAPPGTNTAPDVLPSRFGPDSMSFTALFRTEAETGATPPVEAAPAGQGSAFFTQLYSQ